MCAAWGRPSRGWRARPPPLPRGPPCSAPGRLLYRPPSSPRQAACCPQMGPHSARGPGVPLDHPGVFVTLLPKGSPFSFVLSVLTCFPVFPSFKFLLSILDFPSRGLDPSASRWTGVSLDMNKGPCLRRTEGVHRHRASYLLFKTVFLGCRQSSHVVGQVSPQ